jgi:hypothetical protein
LRKSPEVVVAEENRGNREFGLSVSSIPFHSCYLSRRVDRIRHIDMNSRSIVLFRIGLLCISAIAGCSAVKTNKLPSAAKSILEKADQIELISLDPGLPESGGPPKGDYFGWKELGRTAIENSDTRKNVVAAVEKGFSEAEGGKLCFDPRHALHARHNGKTVDVLICFYCSQVKWRAARAVP